MSVPARYLLRHEIFCPYSDYLRLNPKQDILGHKYHLPGLMHVRIRPVFPQLLRKPLAHLQYPVIHLVIRQIRRERHIHKILLHPQAPAAFQPHSGQQVRVLAQFLQDSYGLTRIGASFPIGFFQVIQLLQYCHRQYNLVILKAVDCIGGLYQHIGVYYIGFNH